MSQQPRTSEEVCPFITVQINGRYTHRVRLAHDADESAARAAIAHDERLVGELKGKSERAFVYSPGRLIRITAVAK